MASGAGCEGEPEFAVAGHGRPCYNRAGGGALSVATGATILPAPSRAGAYREYGPGLFLAPTASGSALTMRDRIRNLSRAQFMREVGMSKKETGRTIRVRPETYARFRAALERLEQAEHEGKVKADWEGELTADIFIRKLLAAREKHTNRAKKHQKKKKEEIRESVANLRFGPKRNWHDEPDGSVYQIPVFDTSRAKGTDRDNS